MIAVRRILCPVDFSETSRHAFEYAVHFAKQCEAELIVVHATEDTPLLTNFGGMPDLNFKSEVEASARKEMAAWVAGCNPGAMRVRTELIRGATYRAILKFAEEQHADLIVMGTHGRSGLDYAFFGSVAERVIRRAPCPVLIVRHPSIKLPAPPGD